MKVLVVCVNRYNGHELWTLLGVLSDAGIDFEVISSETLVRDEITLEPSVLERTLDDVTTLNGFDALAFTSGAMKAIEAYWKDPRTQSLVDEAVNLGLPIAAICCAVPVVRNAAEGRKVSCFPLQRANFMMIDAGALLQTVSISVDGRLVTAEHQAAAQTWAEQFVLLIQGKKPTLDLQDSKYMPPGRNKLPDPDLQRLREISKRTGKTEV